jgi:SAM-dependent methyltransferase
MDMNSIKKHWEDEAKKYKTHLRSTTKTPTIKSLEINEIKKCIEYTLKSGLDILEVGCGNGWNIFPLADYFSDCDFTGVDYSKNMIDSANDIRQEREIKNAQFLVGDALDLENNKGLKKEYDVVFTDRCLINLNTRELQKKALNQIIDKTKDGGYIIFLENSEIAHSNQNDLRESVGLNRRKQPEYNYFIDGSIFDDLEISLVYSNNFSSLHDILLYVLLPKVYGEFNYDNSIMDAVTELLMNIDDKDAFGNYGQNVVYFFQK